MEIRPWLLLLCFSAVFPKTLSQSASYLVTAPKYLRLDAVETVLVQLFGYTQQVELYVILKSTMAPDTVRYSEERLVLNQANNYQAAAKVQVFPKDLVKGATHVILLVQGAAINDHRRIEISRSNGFMFIQTDKPLYTPEQSVKVRVFSLNEELRPANRKVFLTFKDPEGQKVDILELIDHNNGIPSMQNPFKIPLNPKLGVWTIEATYSKDFDTKAMAVFQVKEYVLPSITITVKPEKNFISSDNFQRFAFRISASYVNGVPVREGIVFIRYGFISGNKEPVMFPNSLTRKLLSHSGVVDVTEDIRALLTGNTRSTLESLTEKYLYITVLVQENKGGISEETEYTAVKFVKSPYSLHLISTPRFIKPGLSYNTKVLVRDPLGQPLAGIPVNMVDQCIIRGSPHSCICSGNKESQSDGFIEHICNIPQDATMTVLKFTTADPALSAEGQASFTLEAPLYVSQHRRYLYIQPPQRHSLIVGHTVYIRITATTPNNLHSNVNYLVLAKGKVVTFGVGESADISRRNQIVRLKVTPEMTPSIRLLVYYFIEGEVVADSLWIEVEGKCVNSLKTEFHYRRRDHRPKSHLLLGVSTNQDGLVALSAVDTAIFPLRRNHKDPVNMVLRQIELSDQGCGGGGGKDAQDVFHSAGLTLLTNAIEQGIQSAGTCQEAVRAKRSLTEERKIAMVATHGKVGKCCRKGLRYIPNSVTCEQFAIQSIRQGHQRCRDAFQDCCELLLASIPKELQYSHDLGSDIDMAPLVRSYFPESWLWEVQPVRDRLLSVNRTLPDSLTNWEITAVGMFQNGICVEDRVQVSVSLPVSVNIPLPYQLVRGEQLDLLGSVYNENTEPIQYCVTLTVGPEFCLLHSQSVGDSGLQTTACVWNHLSGSGVGKGGPFTLLGLQAGEHTLTFTLMTRHGPRDIVKKKLRVVPEGVRKEIFSGGRLDPKSIYGSEKKTVLLKNRPLSNLVPDSSVERVISINGEIMGEMLSVVLDPEGLGKLIRSSLGSAESGLDELLPLIHVYRYLEGNQCWNALGEDIQGNSFTLRQKIKTGVVNVLSYRVKDKPSSYSIWKNGGPSTRLTAKVVKTLGLLKDVIEVDYTSLGDSVDWLISDAQNGDGSFKELGTANPKDYSVYLTSFVLISLKRARQTKNRALQLLQKAMERAVHYISQHAMQVESVYVRAVATYALTYYDINNEMAATLFESLENLARQKENPEELRYWQESNVGDWQKPDESSGLTVETTAYVMLTAVLKGRLYYVKPILTWLTQDQHYGGGFFSTEDTVLTLEAITEYSQKLTRTELNQDIVVSGKNIRTAVKLRENIPVAPPIQVQNYGDITVSTGYGNGVSHVKLKTVYYQTTVSFQNCNFDFNIEISKIGPSKSIQRGVFVTLLSVHRYRPPPNEVEPESGLTVLEIQLPTGVQANLDELRPFMDGEIPAILHYELRGNMVIIETQFVPSDIFRCVGFRVRAEFNVVAAAKSIFRVYESEVHGSVCEKQFTFSEEDLQRLCLGKECQCFTAACATYRGNDPTLTATDRMTETCHDHIKYAYKVKIRSAVAEGDFMTYTAIVVQVLKRKDQAFQSVKPGVEVDLVKKATCSSVELHKDAHFLVQGSRGSEVLSNDNVRYRFPLDSDAILELLPNCSPPGCNDPELNQYEEDLQIFGCA
ncbi:unnamed protein product [Lota lota]